MHVSLPREKERVWLVTLIYRLFKPLLALMPTRSRFAFLLDLDWTIQRLCHEESFRFYGDHAHPLRSGFAAFVTRTLKPGQKVLDLGCSHGHVGYLLAKHGLHVVGVDHSAEHVKAAKANYNLPNLSFHHEDAVAYLDRERQPFDALILSHILEHLDQPVEFLKKFSGYFPLIFIEVPDFENTHLNHCRVDAKARILYTDSDHVTEFDREQLLSIVKEADLEVLEQQFRWGVLQLLCRPKAGQ